ncbi:MAG: tetratricopeptide repeat protein [Deltaproteobacteria bacterium]|nr:tetratricopeptide repeat protein [Deltaproteobacteria bacterium]
MRSERGLKLLFIAIAALVSFAVYANTLSNGFVYDDHLQIEKNGWLASFANVPEILTSHVYGFKPELKVTGSYRPLFMLAYLFEYSAFGVKPWGWHLVNVILHAFSVVMVFLIADRLTRGGREEAGAPSVSLVAPFIAALLFAAHPAHNEPVAWVACVPELSYTALYLAALHISVRRERASAVVPAVVYFLALLFKETAVTLPLVVFAYDRLAAKSRGDYLRRYLPFAAALGLYLVLRRSFLGGLAPASTMHPYLDAGKALLNAVIFFADYLRALVLPYRFEPFRVFDPAVSTADPRFLFGALVTSSLIGGIVFYRKKRPLAAFSLIFFSIAILPALYIPALSQNPFAERQAYLPSAALAIGAAAVSSRMIGERFGRAAGALVILLAVTAVFSYATIKRNFAWKDDLSIWTASAVSQEGNYLASHNIAVERAIAGDMDAAIFDYKESIRMNMERRFPDEKTLVLSNLHLGKIYAEKGLHKEAAPRFREAVRIKPDLPEARLNLALALQSSGDLKGAVLEYNRALELPWRREGLKTIYGNMGKALMALGMHEDAMISFEEELKLDPDDAEAARELALARRMTGR